MSHIKGTEQIDYSNWLLFNESINSDRKTVIEAHIESCDSCAVETANIVKIHEPFLNEESIIRLATSYIAKAKMEMGYKTN